MYVSCTEVIKVLLIYFSYPIQYPHVFKLIIIIINILIVPVVTNLWLDYAQLGIGACISIQLWLTCVETPNRKFYSCTYMCVYIIIIIIYYISSYINLGRETCNC